MDDGQRSCDVATAKPAKKAKEVAVKKRDHATQTDVKITGLGDKKPRSNAAATQADGAASKSKKLELDVSSPDQSPKKRNLKRKLKDQPQDDEEEAKTYKRPKKTAK